MSQSAHNSESTPRCVPRLTLPRDMNEEQRINVCKTSVNQIYTALRTSPQNYRNYIALARSIIAHLDSTTFMQQNSRATEQAWVVDGLQRLTALDNGNASTGDIVTWCSRQWSALYQRDPQSVTALRGIGQAWLNRAQAVLGRIQSTDSSSSSSGESNRSSSRSAKSISASEEERQTAAANAEAERRSGTQDYVEARSYLEPATEYLARAVAAASEQRILSGDLLATTAEAYMSLGNTSSPRNNERYFRRALELLRAASNVEGYTLSRYLRQYLDDYGRLLD